MNSNRGSRSHGITKRSWESQRGKQTPRVTPGVSSLGGALEASWTFLGSLLGHFRGSRRTKMVQDGCKAYKGGFELAGRAQRASERSERSDQDETALAESKRRRRSSNGVA